MKHNQSKTFLEGVKVFVGVRVGGA